MRPPERTMERAISVSVSRQSGHGLELERATQDLRAGPLEAWGSNPETETLR